MPVGNHQGIGNDVRFRCITDFFYLYVVPNFAGFRRYRPPALEDTLNADYRFIADTGFCRHPSHALNKDPEGVGTALIHQCSWHDHVIHKMAGQKPVIGMDVRFSPNSAKPVSPAFGIELQNPVDQSHSAARQPERFGKFDANKVGAEAFGKITLS